MGLAPNRMGSATSMQWPRGRRAIPTNWHTVHDGVNDLWRCTVGVAVTFPFTVVMMVHPLAVSDQMFSLDDGGNNNRIACFTNGGDFWDCIGVDAGAIVSRFTTNPTAAVGALAHVHCRFTGGGVDYVWINSVDLTAVTSALALNPAAIDRITVGGRGAGTNTMLGNMHTFACGPGIWDPDEAYLYRNRSWESLAFPHAYYMGDVHQDATTIFDQGVAPALWPLTAVATPVITYGETYL